MSILLENIGSILTSVIGWLGQIASALIQNPIYAVLMAVILLKLLYELIIKIRDIIEIHRMPYFNLDDYDMNNYDYESEYNSLNNKPIEDWTDEDYDEDVLWSYTHDDY